MLQRLPVYIDQRRLGIPKLEDIAYPFGKIKNANVGVPREPRIRILAKNSHDSTRP